MAVKNSTRKTLAAMQPGEKGRVADFLFREKYLIRRLLVLGFLPGQIFVLERKNPDYLIRYGYTRLALNRKLAEGILVEE